MTTNDITFTFRKEPNSSLRCTDILRGTTSIATTSKIHKASALIDQDKCNTAMTTVFKKLIALDAPMFQEAISGLDSFTVTFINNPEQPNSLLIESDAVVIDLRILTEETAALFLNSIPKAQTQASKALQQPPKPVLVEGATTAQVPQTVSAIPTAKKSTPIASPTKQEDPFVDILGAMNQRFMNTQVMLSEHCGKSFGGYLMERLFGRATSHDYNKETSDFTITFAEEQKFNLTKLPEKISKETKKDLEQLQNSILTLPKQVKGKFSENKVSFESGSLTISWPKAWITPDTQILEIYETENGDGTIIIRVKCKIKELFIPVSAQDFANFVECNVTK